MARRNDATGTGAQDDPAFFSTRDEFRAWLARHHDRLSVAWIGFHRVGSGTPSITWAESVDVALMFGWIDGVRHGVDETRYKMRFTPRKRGSNWSTKNVARIRELIEQGLVEPPGLAAFEARREDRSGVYSFERADPATFPREFEAMLRAHPQAAAFFDSQPPGYRRTATHWVMSAKREETRQRRMAQLIEDSANGLRIGPLRR